MEKSYKILLLEDELSDAELCIRQVKKVLPNAVIELVSTGEDFTRMLDTFKPDIILSDYSLPSFDGLSALKMVQEKCPLTPFIMVTGSINEDTAVDCMKAGASDYILKDSLKRLGSAIFTAIEQRDLRMHRIEAEKEMFEIGQSYLNLFNSVSEAIYILNQEMNFIAVNTGAIQMYGYTADEIIGQTPEFLSAPGKNNLEMTFELLKRVYETGETVQFEYWGKRKNGEIFPKEISCNKGRYFGKDVIFATSRDITERKEAEDNLKHEKKLLRTVIDNLPVTIYVKDAKCRKIIANKTDYELLGAKNEAEVLGKTDLETFSFEIGERGYLDDKEIIKSGNPVYNREEYFFDPAGNLHWFNTSKIPLSDENGKISGMVGIGMDITSQKEDQEKILKLSKGIEQSPATIIITDLNGMVEYVNPKFSENTGYTASDILGQNLRVIKSGLIPDEVYKNLWETITSGNIWKGELLNKAKNGRLFWESATITGIKNENGTITNFIAIKEDISESKKLQTELIAAKDRAEESDRLKSAFLANMSHEIRTPLNSIIGFSELLGDPDFDATQKEEFIQTIINNGNSLLVIISDIMDFSMLESHQIKLRKERISSQVLLNDLKNEFSTSMAEKGIELILTIPEDSPNIIFEADLYRIRQIFGNLISNAIKFTERGSIEFGFELKSRFIEFHVKDTGIGIPPVFHQAIFGRFRQMDTERTRKYGGNGLGLAITKNLVNLLGGDIRVESEIGKYSNFYFTIPL